jgi:hypothetical protein
VLIYMHLPTTYFAVLPPTGVCGKPHVHIAHQTSYISRLLLLLLLLDGRRAASALTSQATYAIKTKMRELHIAAAHRIASVTPVAPIPPLFLPPLRAALTTFVQTHRQLLTKLAQSKRAVLANATIAIKPSWEGRQ